MRKSLLLLLSLTVGWLSAYSSNYVLNAGSNAGDHAEQTQSFAKNMLAEGSVFGQFLSKKMFAVANNVQGCDPARTFSTEPNTCSNSNIQWNIPSSGDNEPLTNGYPRIVNTQTMAVVANPPLVQPFTLPVGQYRVEYEYDGDDFCYIPITVVDNQNPTFDNATGCAATYNFVTDGDTCISTIPTGIVAIPTGTDNCSGATVTWTITDLFDGVITGTQAATTAGTFLPDSIELGLGTTTVTFVIEDASGRTATCAATINVTDNNAPVFTDNNGTQVVPAVDYPDQLGNAADAGQCYAPLAFDLPLAFDTCAGSLPVTYYIRENLSMDTIGTANGDIVDFQFPFGTSTVIVTSTDGNFDIDFSFQVEVIDTEKPEVVGCIEDFEVSFRTSNNGTGDCNARVTFPEFLASDNCSGVATKYWEILDKDTAAIAGPYSGTNFPVDVTLEPDTYVVAFSAEDLSGNFSDTCYALFVVSDDEAPARIGGAPAQNQTFNVDATCNVDVTINVPNVGDNSTGCIGNGIQGGFFQFYTIRNLATNNIVSRDTVSNVLTNVTVSFGVGSYQVVWTAEDYSGNSAEIESFQITVNDNIDPTINVNVFGGSNSTTLNLSTQTIINNGCGVAYTIPAISFADNCAVDTVYVNNGTYNQTTNQVSAELVIGTNTFIYTVEDVNGNDVTGIITITVVDDIAPTLNGSFSYPNIEEPVALGQCSFTKSWNIQSFFLPADQCATTLDSVYVILDTNIAMMGGVDTIFARRASDITASSKVTVRFDGPDFTHRITAVAVDKADNKTEKSFTVRAFDDQKPELFYQDTVTVFVNSNDCQSAFAEIIFDEQLVEDNCTNDSTLLANMTNTVGAKGDTVSGFFNISPNPYHPVVFTTRDSRNNTASKTVVIHVVDTILPGIDLTPIDTIANDQRVCTGRTKVFAPVASDACGIDTVQYSINGSAFMGLTPGEIEFPFTFPVGTNTIVWRVVDDNGNTSIDSQFVTVEDVEAPVIEMIQDIALTTNPGECEQNITISFPNVTDNCDSQNSLDSAYIAVDDNNGIIVVGDNGQDLTLSIEPGILYTGYVYAVDIYGNRDSIMFDIELEDIEKPFINCPGTDIELGVNSSNCDASVVLLDQVGFNPADNCTDFTITANDGVQNFDPSVAYDFPVGTTSVKLYIEDNSGNMDSCMFDVVVTNDIASHIFDFPTDTVIATTANECSKRHFWSEPRIVGQGCNGETIEFTRNFNPGQDFPIGTTTVVYTFTRKDSQGNVLQTETRSFDITVEDRQAPVITQKPSDRTLSVGAGCTATLVYADIDYQDNCDAQGITVTIPDSLKSGSVLGIGSYVVEIIVTDMSGNADTASFNVNVVDNTAPVITAPTNTTVCGTNVDLNTLVSVADACGVDTVFFTPSTLNPGSNQIVVTARDASGNESTKTMNITVNDVATASIISDPAEEFCTGVARTFEGTAIPNGGTVTWSVSPSAPISAPNAAVTTITFNNALNYTVTYTVNAGPCGSTTASQTIRAIDNVIADAGADTVRIEGTNSYQLSANPVPGVGNAAWSLVAGNALIANPSSAVTLATGINAIATFRWTVNIEGCATSSDDVTVIPAQEEVEIASGFTPGNANNSTWDLPTEITESDDYANGVVKVYNRWGNLVFESPLSSYNDNKWDGTNEGSELPVATYYYVIDPAKSGVPVITGNVTILR